MNSNPDIKALHKKTQARVQRHKWFQYCRLGLLLSAGFIWFWGFVQYDEFILNVCFLSFMGAVLAGFLEPKLHLREDRLLWEEVAQVEGVMLISLVLDLLASQSTPPKSVDTSALMERFFATLKQVKPHHAPLFTRNHLTYVHSQFLQPTRMIVPNDIRYAKEVLYLVSQVGNDESLRILREFAWSTSRTAEMQELFTYAKGCYDTLAATRRVKHYEVIASDFLLRPSQAPNPDKELLRTIEQEETHHTE